MGLMRLKRLMRLMRIEFRFTARSRNGTPTSSAPWNGPAPVPVGLDPYHQQNRPRPAAEEKSLPNQMATLSMTSRAGQRL